MIRAMSWSDRICEKEVRAKRREVRRDLTSERLWAGPSSRRLRRPALTFPAFRRLPLPSFPQRGSTLILVLAVLSILVLLAATLSYTARLEEISSHNFADGIQSRMAAATGVGSFFLLAEGQTTVGVPLWTAPAAVPPFGDSGLGSAARQSPFTTGGMPVASRTSRMLANALGGRLDQTRGPIIIPESETAQLAGQSSMATNLMHMRVSDESAKININALGSWAEFRTANVSSVGSDGRAIPSTNLPAGGLATAAQSISLSDALYAILSSREVNYPRASPEMAQRLAYAIVRYRYGPDGQPGRAAVDDDGDGSGRPQAGAQNPFGGTSQSAVLYSQSQQSSVYAGGGVDESDEFAADPRLAPKGDDHPFRQVEDLLRVEGMPSGVFQALRPYLTVFSASERRTGPERNAPAQMDLNAATAGEIYQRLRLAVPAVPAQTIAQYVANIVDYRDGNSVPAVFQLEGSTDPILGTEITPCITEVWPDSVTEEQHGDNGEFIEIYNPYDTALALSGWSLRIVGGARATLLGTLVPGGFLIVTDNYNGRNSPQTPDESAGYGSFYRIFGAVPNTRNRLMIEVPTLDIPDRSGMIELRDAAGNLVDYFRYGGDAAGDLRKSYQRADPRLRVTHVARCTPYALSATAGQSSVAGSGNLIPVHSIKNGPFQSALELFSICTTFAGPNESQQAIVWQMPTLSYGRSDTLDERLVDLFTVWTDRPPPAAVGRTATADGVSTFALTVTPSPATGPSSITECGKINLNTAPAPVLRALPGLSDRQIGYLLSRRQSTPQTDVAGNPVVYGRRSELLADDLFWDNAPLSARLAQLGAWIGSVAFTSNAYLIDSENLADPALGSRLASRSKIEALVSTDGAQNQVVFWRYVE